MTTLSTFRNTFIPSLLECIKNGEGHILATSEMIPLCGIIYRRRFGENGGGSNCIFYLAAENGELMQPERIEGNGTIHDEIFNADKMRQQVAALLGVAPDLIGLSEGDEEFMYGDDNACIRWKFAYLSTSDFERLRKPKKVSVVAEYGYGKPVQRWVAPNAVRVRNAKFDFDIATAKLQFVAKHNNSIEYMTEDGIKVFDNRRRQIGFSVGGKGKQSEPLIIREDALRGFLYAIWRGHKAKHSANKETERLRDYTGLALHRIALDSDIPRTEGSIVADGIALLYGAPFVPAVELLGKWDTQYLLSKSWSKRMLLRDANNDDSLNQKDNKLEGCYVVITD